MSAYQCSVDHIAQLAMLLTRGMWGGCQDPILAYDADPQWARTGTSSYDHAFRVLWDANARSVAHRYGGTPDPAPAAPAKWAHVDPLAYTVTVRDFGIRVIKSCDCFAYQSCEVPDWQGSEAHSMIEALRIRALRTIPGFSGAPWGAPFDAPPAAQRVF